MQYCREKNVQLGRLIGMGFDGAATFSGDKTGVQRRLKEHSLQNRSSKKVKRALTTTSFVHSRCHVLQLASVQAANVTPGIKHVYTTLTTFGSSFITPQNVPSHSSRFRKY